jgi:quercetin dioxygenase-like cupin family protein
MPHALRLIEDSVAAGAGLPGALPPLNRVVYVAEGEVAVTSEGGERRLAAGAAWHGAGHCAIRAGAGGARLLRFELYRPPPPGLNGGAAKLDHPLDLAPGGAWLMRCDRVDFAPGGEAPWHRHRGGGIRCLLRGAIEVRVGDAPPARIAPGQAWFESGREPVHAATAPGEETSFIRVTIQPAEIRGQSSLVYVNPADAARKPRTYTVFVDDPIAIP